MIDDDLNEIISELNASGGAAPARSNAARGQLEALLEDVVHRHGSDLLLVAGSPPAIRIDGAVERLSGAIVDGLDIEELVLPALPDRARKQFAEPRDCRSIDVPWSVRRTNNASAR